ncbi:M15 family metallopeptidase [Yeguia hominis]|uniref:M15 family metallopeptidase n=1 Tax=Yeguia hominis TaxID=2763662 RepID=A0A926DBI0_9FIRM|nr:M15 family metallopeptidase [Yeguia hominis]MBC8534822.1 M15 family metallopeptidase [Yeguia hominis]
MLCVLTGFFLLAAGLCVLLFPHRKEAAYQALQTKEPQSKSLQTQSVHTDPELSNYHTVSLKESEIHSGELILVNSENEFWDPADETNLVCVFDGKTASYNVSDKNVEVASQVLAPLNQMLDDFYARYQTDAVLVASGYRSFALQASLLEDEIAQEGSTEAARWITQPGYSEHHTGLAVDLSIYHTETGLSESYDGTGIYSWINENAPRYGFVVRYSNEKQAVTGIAAEPWHFRYVGVPHASVMQENGFCLEEYLSFLQAYAFERQHLRVQCGDTTYTIYYTDQLDVPVPNDRAYSISGNNVDGFIVTVTETT